MQSWPERTQGLPTSHQLLYEDLYPNFYRVAKGLESGNIDLTKGKSVDEDGEFGKTPLTPAPLNESNVITSRYVRPRDANGNAWHKVAIDLDMDAALIPSSTKGHHHLIIDHPLPWGDYKKLLETLRDVGLIQEGYYQASINRGASVLRTPWTKKDGK